MNINIPINKLETFSVKKYFFLTMNCCIKNKENNEKNKNGISDKIFSLNLKRYGLQAIIDIIRIF